MTKHETLEASIATYCAWKRDTADGAKAAKACVALSDLFSTGGWFIIEQAWKDANIDLWKVRDETLEARETWLAAPDNAADKTITIRISGNRLVSLLNALDCFAHETGREWWNASSQRMAVDTIRDVLCSQRNR